MCVHPQNYMVMSKCQGSKCVVMSTCQSNRGLWIVIRAHEDYYCTWSWRYICVFAKMFYFSIIENWPHHNVNISVPFHTALKHALIYRVENKKNKVFIKTLLIFWGYQGEYFLWLIPRHIWYLISAGVKLVVTIHVIIARLLLSKASACVALRN